MDMKELSRLTNEQIQLLDRISEAQGELTLELEEDLKKLETAIVQETDSIVGFLRVSDDHVGIIQNRIDELEELKKFKNNKKNKVIGYIRYCLDRMKRSEVKGMFYKLSVRKDTASVDREFIMENIDELPADYIKMIPAHTDIDAAAIRKDLMDGKIIPGARLKFTKGSISYK